MNRRSKLLPGGELALRVSLACLGFAVQGAQPAPKYLHFEARHTHPITLSADGTRLLAVNSPDARLSVFDVSNPGNPAPVLVAEIPVGLEPVSVRLGSDGEAWVVNEVSDSVSIVSLSRSVVVATLACPDEPADVVFASGRAFVTCARNNLLRVFDIDTRAPLAVLQLEGGQPRAMAASADGSTVYVAFQNSGNGTTILPAAVAPPQPDPTNAALPPAPDTALIVPVEDPRIRYRVIDHDVAEISAADLRVTRYHSNTGTSLFDLAVRPGTKELWVANTEARNLVRFEPALRGHFVDNRLTRIGTLDGASSTFDLNPKTDYGILPNPASQADALAQPTAVVFTPDGSSGWLTAFGSDRVARFDPRDGTVLGRVDVRVAPGDGSANDFRHLRGPRGLALDETRHRLFVLNKLANTLSVIDTAALEVVAEVPAGSHDPTPREIREARGALFDARLSGNGTASCASCHLDADRDGLAWDLGDPGGAMQTVIGANLAVHDPTPLSRSMHPMKGPMVTQTLWGIATNALLHWRGDRASLRDFGATFADLMGGDPQPAATMDALAGYLASLRHHPNPNRTLTNGLPTRLDGADPERGRALFSAHANHCAICHVLPSGSDNNIDDLRNFGGLQSIKTPPLQTTYQRMGLDSRVGATNYTGFGLLHDGTGGRQSLPTVHFYELDILGEADFGNVAAFLRCFDSGTAAAVGWSRTIQSEDAIAVQTDPELALVESQARRTNSCDLLVRGRFGGHPRQFVYDAAADTYIGDRVGEAPLSRLQLLALMGPEDAATFLSVPPGKANSMAMDRNANGVPDRDEPVPDLQLIATPAGFMARWHTDFAGWLLEYSDTIGSGWSPVLQPVTKNGSELTSSIPEAHGRSRFLRLRRTW